MKKTALISSILFATPLFAFAANPDLDPLKRLVASVGEILNALIPILIVVAIIVFFWGLVKYVSSQGKDHAQGRNIMIAGILALFVMVSVWGIVRLVQSSLGITDNRGFFAPSVPTYNGSSNSGSGGVPYSSYCGGPGLPAC